MSRVEVEYCCSNQPCTLLRGESEEAKCVTISKTYYLTIATVYRKHTV